MQTTKTYITINTDASWKDHKAGMAAWIVFNAPEKQSLRVSWNAQAANSAVAEELAIKFALELVLEQRLPGDVIVINTDAQAAINKARAKRPTEFSEVIAKLSKPVVFKKVKAHTIGADPRHYVNNWCDAAAKHARVYKSNDKN